MKRSTMLGGSLTLVTLATLAACSPGPGEPGFHGGPTPTTTSLGTEPPPGDDAAAPKADGGTHDDAAATDGGHGVPPKDAFGGAGAYAAMSGPVTRKAAHSFLANAPKTNPAGQACLTCHGTSGGALAFAAAGTVYAGAAPAPSVEVRAVGKDGKAYSAYTDADGNFFFLAAAAPIAFPAMVGARNASGPRLMTALSQNGSCNGCHSAPGGAGHIVVTP